MQSAHYLSIAESSASMYQHFVDTLCNRNPMQDGLYPSVAQPSARLHLTILDLKLALAGEAGPGHPCTLPGLSLR